MAIELRLLEHALAVGTHRNFARAAEALGLSQPSLSRSVASLERQLGVRLFDRTPRGVVPTTFGYLLLERGASVLQREADLRREIGPLAGLDSGTLAVAAGPYPAETFVAEAIGRLSRKHPGLRISLMQAEAAHVSEAERSDWEGIPSDIKKIVMEHGEAGSVCLDGAASNAVPGICAQRQPQPLRGAVFRAPGEAGGSGAG